jgi:hypothetical protein
MPHGIIALVFRCKTTGGELAPSGESQAFRWATEDLARGLATEAYAIRITDAMQDAPAVIRQHDGTWLLP